MQPQRTARLIDDAATMTVPDDVVVIVPTYNEAENLESIAAAVRAHGYRLLIVDDGSPDGTGEIADTLAAADEGVAVLHRRTKAGLGKAYAAGFARALELDGKVLCEMDADFSHDPSDLPRLIAAIDEGADLAIGSRYVPGGGVDDWPWHRRAISSGGNRYAALMLGIKVKDATAGYRAFRADAIRRLRPETCDASGYAFQVEMAWRASEAGLKITEIPIRFRDREAGTSKMSTSVALEAMALVTRWGWQRRFGRK
jgi:dolichol-phosphate mannosyltransferase